MAIPLRHADPINITAATRTFFVSSSIAGKRNLLQSHRSAKLFVDVIYHYRSQHKFLLHDFVGHARPFSRVDHPRTGSQRRARSPIYQGWICFPGRKGAGIQAPRLARGFSEVRVFHAVGFARVREYIVGNPVKRGLAINSVEYEYSSASDEFDLDEVPQGLKPKNLLESIRHV